MDQRIVRWIVMLFFSWGPFVPVTNGNSSWKPCSGSIEDYKVTVMDVKVKPDPVVRGDDMTVEIPAVTSETIAGGTITVQVYYLGVPVHTEKDDLCSKTSCPVAPGQFSIKNSQGLPDFTPTGSYRLDVRMQDEDGNVLTCVKVNFWIAAHDIQSE